MHTARLCTLSPGLGCLRAVQAGERKCFVVASEVRQASPDPGLMTLSMETSAADAEPVSDKNQEDENGVDSNTTYRVEDR